MTTFSFKRSAAILQKDYKDVSKNLFVSSSALMPLIIAALYGRFGVETVNEHYLVFNMVFCLVSAYVQCSLIAEEKEKSTLRGLMLSPASTLEILVGKSLLSLLGTLFIIIICAVLTEYLPKNPLVIAISIIISTFFYIGLGTLLGLMTKSVMEASVIILPFIFILSFGDFLTAFSDRYPFLKVAEFMPNSQLITLANEVQSGANLIDVWSNLAIILIWVAVVFIFVIFVYRKRMMD